jgi:Fic family protein
MFSGEYIWQSAHWPVWRYDLPALAGLLTQVSHAQGRLLGRLADFGLALRNEASLAALTEEIVQTSAIEGEGLNVASVRSSVARRLGVDIGAVAPVDRHVEGIVEIVLDAAAGADEPMTLQRLFGWHAALFPTGYSGMSPIATGKWRDDAHRPMQVVSGAVHRQRVHYEAPRIAYRSRWNVSWHG